MAAWSKHLHNRPNLPAQIAEAISGVPKALVPASVKALDRLIGAAVDIPVAWLGQKKAKIDAQTQAYAAVEIAISKAVSTEVGATPEIVQQAMNVLVRKEYRKQTNRNAVGRAALKDLRTIDPESTSSGAPELVDDDWLNIFERYAEDASTERMQDLWGRVLAGEIRNPGSHSLRTLRFLSEFSQQDALAFENFCDSAFGEAVPVSLVRPDNGEDLRNLLFLEALGLVKGVDGFGIDHTIDFREDGIGFVREGGFAIIFIGEPGTSFSYDAIALTPLGRELLALLPARDARAAAKRVASAIKQPKIRKAYLARVLDDDVGETLQMEVFWQDEAKVDVGDA